MAAGYFWAVLVVAVVEGVTPDLMSPMDLTECYRVEGGKAYYWGTVNVTKTGRTCQRWDVQYPHVHDRGPMLLLIPEMPTVTSQANYCRDPDKEVGPWCYTTDPLVRWQYCDIPVCPNSTSTVAFVTATSTDSSWGWSLDTPVLATASVSPESGWWSLPTLGHVTASMPQTRPGDPESSGFPLEGSDSSALLFASTAPPLPPSLSVDVSAGSVALLSEASTSATEVLDLSSSLSVAASPATPLVPMETQLPSSPPSKVPGKLCLCRHNCLQAAPQLQVLAETPVVNRRDTSLQRRKMTCASDNRPSARFTGYTAILVLGVLSALIAGGDVISLVRWTARRLARH